MGVLLGAALLLAVQATRAGADANRCGTTTPNVPPSSVNGFGSQWYDEHGIVEEAPPDDFFGYGGIEYNNQRPSAQVNLLNNNSTQVYLSGTKQCVTVGELGNAPNVGEYPELPPPAIVKIPWLHRDGRFFQATDGRTTILRGFTYPYNTNWPDVEYNLSDADMARIHSWGFNLLRIIVDSFLAGWNLNIPPQPGYWSNLDRLIADANRHRIYVVLATVGDSEEDMQAGGKAQEEAKFYKGTAANEWWLRFETTMFRRYRNWPGVVGFDTMNEDDSYPPPVIDRSFMGPAHRQLDAALRSEVHDTRHIYFQEPSGWAYWGAQFTGGPGSTGMMNGVDIGDPNRFFCPKWEANGDSSADIATDELMARQSGVPMMICELWITSEAGLGNNGASASDPSAIVAQSEATLAAMDSWLVGGARYMYGPDANNGTTYDGKVAPWVPSYARPYPEWVGGTIDSINYSFSVRRLVVSLSLDGHGRSGFFVGYPGTYPHGFVATSSTGGYLVYDGSKVLRAKGMSWDRRDHWVVLPAGRREVTFVLQPRLVG